MTWSRFRLTGLLLLHFAFLTACATAVISPEMESEYGDEMSHQVQDQIGLYNDPDLAAYVSAVGQRLVGSLDATPYRFHFAIVDQFEPNAFATPGGYIYVSRGLLATLNDEMDLAGVLAHEIGHVVLRHHARQAGRSMGAGLLTLPGRAVGVFSEGLGNMINAPIEAAGEVFLASYSRSQESDADQYGLQLAAKSGYDPNGLPRALDSIERTVVELSGQHHKASFFDSHPTTPTRLADISQQITSIPLALRAPVATRAQLYKHLDGLWWGQQNPQGGVFENDSYRNADMDFTIAFAKGWKTINTPRFVGATQPDGGAYIALSSTQSELKFNQLGDALQEKMRKQTGLEPSERRTFQIGDWPAQLIRYDDNSGSETVSLYYLFVASPHSTFTVMAMGLERYRESLRETVLSLRQLSAHESASIKGQRLRLAQIRAGETLASFDKRVANQWPDELTAIFNGVDASEQSPSTRTLKIIRTERYRPQGR
ncbi:MAG: M48 family metalloprotease [Proteobacteria bacterium]|nr:M48 family metalloprotease [Pseudomonadota bacterium]